MRVRLVRKLANWIDGIDLRHCGVGDLVDLPERQARIMTVERWAVLARRAGDLVVSTDSEEPLASAFAEGRRLHGDRRRSSRLNDLYQRLRDKREEIDQERRRLRRRSTDVGQPSTTHAA